NRARTRACCQINAVCRSPFLFVPGSIQRQVQCVDRYRAARSGDRNVVGFRLPIATGGIAGRQSNRVATGGLISVARVLRRAGATVAERPTPDSRDTTRGVCASDGQWRDAAERSAAEGG